MAARNLIFAGAILAAALGACVPAVKSTYNWASTSSNPGSPVKVGECPFTVEFPGPVQSMTNVPKETNIDRALVLANSDNSAVLLGICGCSDTLNLADIPEAVAVQGLQWQLRSSGGEVSEIEFVDDGANGKILSAMMDTNDAQGHLQLKARANYFSKCYFLVAGGGPFGSYDRQRVKQFIESAKRIGTEPASVSPPSSDTVRRLEELKALRDRNLITPQEYETRRKAILDAL